MRPAASVLDPYALPADPRERRAIFARRPRGTGLTDDRAADRDAATRRASDLELRLAEARARHPREQSVRHVRASSSTKLLADRRPLPAPRAICGRDSRRQPPSGSLVLPSRPRRNTSSRRSQATGAATGWSARLDSYDHPRGERLLTAARRWWANVLGLGDDCYEQRVPDRIWDAVRPQTSGPCSPVCGEGDGSWTLVSGGPSVIARVSGPSARSSPTASLRLLASSGSWPSRRVARTAKSTKDTHWLTDQRCRAGRARHRARAEPRTEREVLASHRPAERSASLRRVPALRDGAACVRGSAIERTAFSGPVYSLEVPGRAHLRDDGRPVAHNCFPKDVQALKQLAGNTGYHFQLLTAVIEVNELQKRRTIGKLQKHLGSLVGKEIALLGRRLQAGHRRHARGHEPRARRRGCREREPTFASTTPWPPTGARVARRRELCDSALDAVDGADAVVLVTEWPEFRELDWAGEVKRRHAARRSLSTAATSSTARRSRPPGSPTRASAGSACRHSSSRAARARGSGRSPTPRPSRSCRSPDDRSCRSCSTGSAATAWRR